MSEYEELVELGFEGVDRIAGSKYHDKVYDHLPAWKKKQRKQQQHQQQQEQAQAQAQQRQNSRKDARSAKDRSRSNSPATRNVNFAEDGMSSYAASYAPDGRPGHRDGGRDESRDEHRDDRAPRYVREEQVYYASPSPGAIVMRDNEAYGGRAGYEVTPRVPSPPGGYGGQYGAPRTRSTERYDDDDLRRRHRSRSRRRSGSREGMDKHRIAATLIGGLVGGLAGNQLRKGQKFDTAATIGGAVLGGIASREIADRIGHRKEERERRRDYY